MFQSTDLLSTNDVNSVTWYRPPRFRRASQWRLPRWALAVLVGLAFSQQTRGDETLTLQGTSPRIDFNDITSPTYFWTVFADDAGFDIADYKFSVAGLFPFHIEPATPTNTLILTRDSEGLGNVGINGYPDNGAHLQITAPETSVIRMAQSAIPFYKWELLANHLNWFVRDTSAGTSPFVIASGTPSFGLTVQPDPGSTGATNVGIGGVPDAGAHLQVSAPDVPVIRMAQTASPFHSWDIASSDSSWVVRNNGTGHVPLVIDAAATSYNIFLAKNGNVGLGTSVPDRIGNVTTAGNARMLNLLSNGQARLVIQGGLGSEMYFVHLGGAVNRKIARFGVDGGKFRIGSVLDNLTGNVEPFGFCLDMTTTNVGIKTGNPAFPLQVGDAGANDGNGAHVTAGGVWTNASSRSVKQDIHSITSEQARETVRALQPVGYRYKNEPDEQYLGFIAEDVPELVATRDRKSLAPMDIAAVLTRVVQDQDRQLGEYRRQNDQLQRTVERQQAMLQQQQRRTEQQQELLASLAKRLADVEQTRGQALSPSR